MLTGIGSGLIAGTGIAALVRSCTETFVTRPYVLLKERRVLEDWSFGREIEENHMLTIMVATVVALSLAGLVLLKSRVSGPEQLDQPRPDLLTIGVQIICGDCCGEDHQPIKTYMNRYGSCSQCGGTSYLLASTVAAHGLAYRVSQLRESQIAASNGRVLPFEVP